MIDKQSSFSYHAHCTALTVLIATALLFVMPVQADDIEEPSLTPNAAFVTENTLNEAVEGGFLATQDQPLALKGEQDELASAAELVAEVVIDDGLADDEAAQSASTLPKNLSPWGMFTAADWVVKSVMIILALASLLTWTVLVSKTFELSSLKRSLRKSRIAVSSSRTLADAANAGNILNVGRELIDAAESELQLSSDILNKEQSSGDIKEGVKERVAYSLSRIEAASTRRMMIGTGLLASIGAISPFVGLFGTVWGIMNSFIGISEAKTTNLAVVAPGIAEALLATALGLVAAIPAVIIYNYFTRQISGVRAVVSDISTSVMRLVSRDLDRGILLTIVKSSVAPVKPVVKTAE